jgi:hypothetical protein
MSKRIKISCEFILDPTIADPKDGITLEEWKENYLQFLADNVADIEAILGLKFEELT